MMRAPMLGCRQRRKARQLRGSRSWRLHQMHSRTHRHVSIGVLHSYGATYINAAFLHQIFDSNVPCTIFFPQQLHHTSCISTGAVARLQRNRRGLLGPVVLPHRCPDRPWASCLCCWRTEAGTWPIWHAIPGMPQCRHTALFVESQHHLDHWRSLAESLLTYFVSSSLPNATQ